MSADYWKSTQCLKWTFAPNHQKFGDVSGRLEFDEYSLLKGFFAQMIQTLVKFLRLKQRVAATATIYFRRFYFVLGFDQSVPDPFLIAVTCIYVASKVEECGVQASAVVREAKRYDRDNFRQTTERAVLEEEFELLSSLNFDLIVHHPYRSLVKYHEDAKAPSETLQIAWAIVNDSYKSDASLVFAPHHIALAALYMATQATQHDSRSWFQQLNLDFSQVMEVVDKLSCMYRLLSMQGPPQAAKERVMASLRKCKSLTT
eukprot:c15135_g1_i1.p1 GENE.c15135_g1_i1~~c15135_g1_i1.p1  ORF type:complete len:259 (-),score=65.08 c15135_g1_i1:121-897(-)